MKKDNLDHQISKLPKQYMSDTQKKKNWTQIQNKLSEPSRHKPWFIYPLTAVVFVSFIFTLLLNFGEKSLVNAPQQENEMTKHVMVFEGHEPFIDISIISNALPQKFELSTAAGYIFRAAGFYGNEEVDPIKSENPAKNLIEEYRIDDKQMLDDSSETFWYLYKALELLKGRKGATELTKLIERQVEELEIMQQADSIEPYRDQYIRISEDLIYLARAIQDITPESTILEGEGEQWDITLQHLEGHQENERYLLSIFFKDINNKEKFEGVGKTEIKVFDGEIEIFSQKRYIGSGGTYTDFAPPIDLKKIDDLKITIHWEDGQKDTVKLNKEVY